MTLIITSDGHLFKIALHLNISSKDNAMQLRKRKGAGFVMHCSGAACGTCMRKKVALDTHWATQRRQCEITILEADIWRGAQARLYLIWLLQSPSCFWKRRKPFWEKNVLFIFIHVHGFMKRARVRPVFGKEWNEKRSANLQK